MIKLNHLAKYRLVLTVRSPVFIGSGLEVTKKEYYFDRRGKQVHILNLEKFIRLIVDKGLLDAYENFILRGAYNVYLDGFFRDHNVSRTEIEAVTDYKINSADALTPEHSLKGIKLFMRDSSRQPYIPGSSLKGALRTAILVKMLLDDNGQRERNAGSFLSAIRGLQTGSRNYAKQATEQAEENYINTLGLNRLRPADAVNSIMRGISVSDSLPVRDKDAMILCGKRDLSVSGLVKPLNVVRECLKPGVKVFFDLSLDSSIPSGIDLNYIKEAVRAFGTYYAGNFDRRFKKPADAVAENYRDALILGGGAGFFSKTFVYELLGKTEGLKFVSNYMKGQFPRHKHEKDLETGISPHRLKYTVYRNQSWHFGICGVEIF
jgi:CRISPR-associated protein Csm5